MPVMRIRLLCLAALALVATALVVPGSASAADKPSNKTLYHDGPSGRFLMDGEWLFRLDDADQGVKQRFMRQAGTTGWKPVTVPNVWNLGDPSNASMAGSIGWYRKDFELPNADSALAWVIRFESVNYRTRVWLNGKPVGENRGAYIPFEFRLNNVKRRGTNRLVVRVDSRRFPTDFPPSGLNVDGVPTGGWWNYGGIQREVYLRRVDTVDWKSVHVRPELACATCTARVVTSIDVRNVTGSSKRVTVSGRFGSQRLDLGTRGIPGGGIARFQKTITVRNPRLWSPASPNLYDVSLNATVGGKRVAGYVLRSGIRSIKVVNGHLVLNGQNLNFRGVGLHEASKEEGFAIDNGVRARLVTEAKALGATVLRTHYPMHPYIHELADRLGLLIWSEVPVYAVKTQYLKRPLVRQLAAKELAKNIEANQNHPSVMLWSIGNELSARPGPVQMAYIRAAAKEAKELDPTRPVGLAVAGYPSVGCQASAYAPLDVIGFNEYFGWYPGPQGQIFDRTKLPGYLDSLRSCYTGKAIVVSEFGAEANRDGPVEEKGTYAFQQDFVNYHLGVYATKPWLSGAIYWALNEFWVRPGWEGGNPRPQSPLFQKGLLNYGTWTRKPAWADVNRWYTQTQQLTPLQ
jgi:beta-glucuronidase